MLIIGNTNNKPHKYFSILEKYSPQSSVQLGNFGGRMAYESYLDYPIDTTKHNIIMGTNDYYPYIHYTLGDYGFFELEGKMFSFVRGGQTLYRKDKMPIRPNNIGDEMFFDSYFVEEELSPNDFSLMAQAMPYRTPKIMLSHECPQLVYEEILGRSDQSVTRSGLQHILDRYVPDVWVFSSHGESFNATIDGCNFVCLGELETLNI